MDPALRVTPLHDDLTRGVRPALLAILGAVALLLVIACVNVTNLLLARGVQRQGEFALRAALGASRGRLIRQLLTESLLLAALGGALGMGRRGPRCARAVALSPPTLPRADAIGVNGTVFLLGFAITTVIGLVFGVAPSAAGFPKRSPRQPPARVASYRRAGIAGRAPRWLSPRCRSPWCCW